MQLYLVQHGAAKDEMEDPQRGLSEEGQRTVEQLANFLSGLQLSIDRIEHSGKLRAKQTAEILATQLGPQEGTKEVRGMAPKDDVKVIHSRLQTEVNDLMLVGHLPHLSRLLSKLLGLEESYEVLQFQMGGIVRLERNEAGRWVVRWVVVPEIFSLS